MYSKTIGLMLLSIVAVSVSGVPASTPSSRNFYQRSGLTYGPTRLSPGWTASSRISCISTCLIRHSKSCTTVMYNSQTQLCTPGKELDTAEPPPTPAEGQLYQIKLEIDCDGIFQLHEVDNSFICIAYIEQYKTHQASDDYCKLLDTRLFAANSVAKVQLIQSFIKADTWIGLDDIEQQDRYIWRADGTVLTPEQREAVFNPGEPNDTNQSQNCVYLNSYSRGSDQRCGSSRHFICEKPL